MHECYNMNTFIIYYILVSFKNFGIKTPEDGMIPKHGKSNKRLYFYVSKVHYLVLGMNYCMKASRLGTWDLCTPEVKLFHFISTWLLTCMWKQKYCSIDSFYSFWTWSLTAADDKSQFYTYVCWYASDWKCASGLNTYFFWKSMTVKAIMLMF